MELHPLNHGSVSCVSDLILHTLIACVIFGGESSILVIHMIQKVRWSVYQSELFIQCYITRQE